MFQPPSFLNRTTRKVRLTKTIYTVCRRFRYRQIIPQTPAKIALGDKLFHDKRFSIDGTVSCSNCHDDKKAFTDGLPVSLGHHGLTGTRNTPNVLNAALNQSQFWDGREADLKGQAKQSLINPVEHGLAPSWAPMALPVPSAIPMRPIPIPKPIRK
ncbi:MAG: cytochrome-c peroxidase [Methylobacter sp.]|nr:cytochrome-c peroxidase [Methylobacter sp.]